MGELKLNKEIGLKFEKKVKEKTINYEEERRQRNERRMMNQTALTAQQKNVLVVDQSADDYVDSPQMINP